MSDSFFHVLAVAFAFSLLGLALYLSTRILRVLDFTCTASLSLGGCSYAAMVLYKVHPLVATVSAVVLGALAGLVTASLSSNLKIKTAVSSIIVGVMSQVFIYKMSFIGNFALNHSAEDVIPQLNSVAMLLITGISSTLVCLLFHRVITSEYGLAMRVYGDGDLVSESLGIDSGKMLRTGLMISNAMVALSGVIIVQITKTFSTDMGIGAFVFGMGTIVLIDRIHPNIDIKKVTLICGLVSFTYKIVIDVLSRSLLGSVGGQEHTVYEHIISAITLIILVALTFNDKNQKYSIFHEN